MIAHASRSKLRPGGYLLLGHCRVADQPVERLRAAPPARATSSTASRCRAPRPRTRGTRRRVRAIGASERGWRDEQRSSAIRVLVIDDSAFSRRRRSSRMLETLAAGRGGGRARDGEEALRKTFELQPRPDHARSRDAAHGRLHVPAPRDGQASDAGDRGQRPRAARTTCSRRSSSARSTSSPSRRRARRPSSRRSSRS